MIAGTVNIYHEAVIHLKVHGPNGQHLDVDTIIDTGFSGWLSLHSVLIAELGLSCRRRGRALLADGSETVFDYRLCRTRNQKGNRQTRQHAKLRFLANNNNETIPCAATEQAATKRLTWLSRVNQQ
jgi:hypothetical protein